MALTGAQQDHLAGAIYAFSTAMRNKYAAGQAQHGGDMWLKSGMLKEAQAEVIDQWTYLFTLEQQLREKAPSLAAYLMGESDTP